MRLSVPGAELHWAVEGDSGPWLTLVNGYTRPMSDFRLMARSLRGFRCLMFDNRGSGETRIEREFTVHEMMDDIVALWRHLDISQSALLGISMGGVIAQYTAATYPALVSRLILVSTTCDDQYVHLIDQTWGTDLAAIRDRLALHVTASFAEKNSLLLDAMAKQIAKSVNDGDFERHAALQRRAFPSYNTLHLLHNIVCPTLILHGDQDQIISAEAARKIHTQVHDSKLLMMEGAGHLLLAEKSGPLREAILKFLTDEPIKAF